MNDEDFQVGIIYVYSSNVGNGYYKVFVEGKSTLVRTYENYQVKDEIKFPGLFWQDDKKFEMCNQFLIKNYFPPIVEKSQLLKNYDEYCYWKLNKPRKVSTNLIMGLDFIQVCESILGQSSIYYDKTGLFWMWNTERRCWERKDDTDILNEAYTVLQYGGVVDRRDKVLAAMKMVGRRNTPAEKSKKWIQFKDVVYNLDTGETFEASDKNFFVNPLSWKLGDNEETPLIDKLFAEWVGEENKIMLYEAVAYCMLEDYPIHRLFAFIGSGRNGKGSFLRLIHKFIGNQNSTSTSLDKLKDSRFEAAKLYKKTVAFVGETNFTEIRESALLKSLTGQDLIGGEFKNKEPFDFYNYAKLLIATNSLPITHDKTQGFYSRWIIVNFPNKYDNGKDVLLEIPDYEYENLGRKSIRILKELLDRGYFTKERNLEDKARDYEEKSNPLVSFIKTRCRKDPYASIPLWEFYDEFTPFLTQNGYRIQSKKEVSSLLRQMGYEVERRTTTRDGVQKTYFMILNLTFITEITEITVSPLNTKEVGSDTKHSNLGNVSNGNCPRCDVSVYKQGMNCPRCNFWEEAS